MRREGKRLLFLLALFLCLPVMAQHQMKDVFIMVRLQQDGSAHVTERREALMSDVGTEGFIKFNNMGDIEVTDLKVTDETDAEYVVEQNWDVERSREAKKNHCGYHHTSEGVELCWGIGDSGDRIYTISYTLTHLVKAYEDYDGFCHSFYEAENTPAEKATVTIRVEGDSLTKQKARIWSFGYDGWKGHTDGFMWAQADTLMRNGDALILLCEFEKGIMQPEVKREGTFKELVKRPALIDSEYDFNIAMGDSVVDTEKNTTRSSLMGGETDETTGHQQQYKPDLGGEGSLDWALVVGFLVITGLIGWAASGKIKDGIEDRKYRKRVREYLMRLLGGKKYEEMPYYRNLPQDGNLLRSGATLAAIANRGSLVGMPIPGLSFNLQNLYEAFVLRMFSKGGITFDYDTNSQGKTRKLFRIHQPVSPEKGKNVLSEMSTNEILMTSERRTAMQARYKNLFFDEGIEYALQDLLYKASGSDHLLQPDELKNYVKENTEEWRPLADALDLLGNAELKESLLKEEEVQQVVGFWHYLKDFSLVAERNIEEVKLWKEYLVYATFYGMAEQVRRDMKKVAPDVTRLEELLPPRMDLAPIATALASSFTYARHWESAYERARREAREERERERSSYSYSSRSYSSSSGGSGHSSHFGGGGHSGGGGSGFR